MEANGWDDSARPSSSIRPPQHHAHDSDEDWSSTDGSFQQETAPSSPFGHMTYALRRPAAVVRTNSIGSSAETNNNKNPNEQIGFHPGQQTRHRSPIPPQHKAQLQQQQQQQHATSKPTAARRTAPRIHPQQQQQRPLKFGSVVRLFVVIGGLGYAVLMMMLFSNPNFSSDYPVVYPNSNRHSFSSRHAADMARYDLRRQSEKEAKKRAQERRRKTKPKSYSKQNLQRYEILLADDERRGAATPDPIYMGRKQPTPASLSDLCGTHARNASLSHANSYLAYDALNEKARVMITGILNPIGFHLALKLQQECGVQVMTGIDPMYPNTVANRLDILPRIQTLATMIPKMVQPIVLPYIGLNPRINTKRRSGKRPLLLDSTREFNLLSFHPTHIVHLASYTPEMYQDVKARKEGRINVNSPYVKDETYPPMYYARSSMMAMEHVLSSVAGEGNFHNRPHVTYASSLDVSSSSSGKQDFHSKLKLVDEVMADAYHSIKGVTAVGLRLPRAIYGPHGRPDTPEHDLAQAVVRDWHLDVSSSSLLDKANVTNAERDFLFVDDVVDAIIAAMQYRPESSSPAVFDIGPASVSSLSRAAEIMENLKPLGSPQVALSTSVRSGLDYPKTANYLKWSPTTPLTLGIQKLLAWHLDEKNPYGAPLPQPKSYKQATLAPKPESAYETGDAFLERHSAPTCAVDDVYCHLGSLPLPCVSECTTKTHCAPSVLDDMLELSKEVTKGCDIIMYTQSLGYDVQDLNLESQYMEDGKRIVCNFAFIPKDSKLTKTVTKKVPSEQLEKFGVKIDKDRPDWEERRLEGLNGRLLYKGWILLWVDDGLKPLSQADEYLLKMTPAKFFAKSVTHAMYVSEDFPVTPNIQDVLFLADETFRPRFKRRSVYRNEDDGKKHKYVLEEEPERRAVLLASPLKRMKMGNQLDKTEKMTVHDATKYMIFETGGDPMAAEPIELRKQREFYERVPTFVNRMDMRSPFENIYHYELQNWIRSRWIVHDLRVDEGREVRCKWYSEHVQWNNELDQLSFGHVMNMLELKRRLVRNEPDERARNAEERPEILKELTDAHEWHGILGVRSLAELKEVERTAKEDEVVEENPVEEMEKDPIWYVRILSERFMLQARKAWVERQRRKMKKR